MHWAVAILDSNTAGLFLPNNSSLDRVLNSAKPLIGKYSLLRLASAKILFSAS